MQVHHPSPGWIDLVSSLGKLAKDDKSKKPVGQIRDRVWRHNIDSHGVWQDLIKSKLFPFSIKAAENNKEWKKVWAKQTSETDFPEFSIDDFPADENPRKPGEYRLWLAVLIEAFFILRDGRDGAGPARSFIFVDNQFFWLCREPARIWAPRRYGERIKKALEDK